jgi:hypothetical protein
MLLTGELEILAFTLTSLFVGYKVRKGNGWRISSKPRDRSSVQVRGVMKLKAEELKC